MKNGRQIVTLALLAVSVLALATNVLQGQAQTGEQKREHHQAAQARAPEIFCPGKPAGQLCGHGSADVLKLEGVKKQRWGEAANRYNKAVDAATKLLLEEAKEILSPKEFAIVEKWFDKSLNVQLNRQLAEKQR